MSAASLALVVVLVLQVAGTALGTLSWAFRGEPVAGARPPPGG